MALPLNNTFEGGTNAVSVTAGNSGGVSGDAFVSVTGTALKFSSAQFMHGTLGAEAVSAAATAFGVWDSTVVGAAQAHLYGRAYVNFSSLAPSTNARFIQFLSGATVAAGIRMNTTGALQCDAGTGGNTGTGTTLAGLSIDTWYRLEWDALFGTGTAGIITVNAYVGDSLSSFGSFSTGATFTNTVASADAIHIGLTTSPPAAPWTIRFDDINLNATGLPGPSGGATTQKVRPDADLATTGWTTTPLFSKVNDQSDATLITGTLA